MPINMLPPAVWPSSSSEAQSTWVRDELILALDMYLRYAGNPPQKGSPEIDELSDTLNRLGRYLGIATADRFRNSTAFT
jgi:5-methylcytosine-specific restriction protein A